MELQNNTTDTSCQIHKPVQSKVVLCDIQSWLWTIFIIVYY